MPEHIQRDYLRRLLRAVEKGERTPEHAADVIISLINENYELKHEPLILCEHCVWENYGHKPEPNEPEHNYPE